MKKLFIAFICIFSVTASAQNKEIQVEDIWKYYRFYAQGVSGLRSMNDGTHCTSIQKLKSAAGIVKTNYATGDDVGIITDNNELSELAGTKIYVGDYTFSADESKLLLATETEGIYRHSSRSIYWVFDIESKKMEKVSDDKIRYATFSPEGNKVAFVLGNNLYIKDFESGEETQVTTDGEKNHIINGAVDWVYEEEFGFARGFQWSSDGQYIAYYKFDESMVPEFSMDVYGNGLYPQQDVFKYPKAGEENAKVSCFVYQLENKKNIEVLKGFDYEYIPRIKATQAKGEFCIYTMNRLQNHLVLHKLNAESGFAGVWYEEKDEAYVEISDDVRFLKDGSFIWTSDKSGFNHIYHVKSNGKIKAITKGDWDVTKFYGINEETGMLYYQSAEVHSTERNVYSITLKGKNKKSLTPEKGTSSAAFSKNFNYFYATFSNAMTPTQVSVRTKDGEVLRTITKNEDTKSVMNQYNIQPKEFMTVKTKSGNELNAWMIKPADFDPNKQYPLWMCVYGGPGAQEVSNSYDGFNGMWYQMLAQKGYIVVAVDNRGTGAKGRDFKKATYKNLGKLEVIDQIESAQYFGALPYVDAERIGIWGWSYGGYMSSNCLFQGHEVFKAAIAVAPVTNWKFYDSIYTERYNGLPKDNDAGYEDNSPINHTDKLKGNYLLVHGSADDNVHVQNTMRLVESLVQANKDFDLFIYPDKNHGIYGGNTRLHLYNKMTKFILNNL